MYDNEPQKPPFSAEEIRILGCLMEKQLTTPNNYPLSINSLTLACNQKSSREPLMNLKEGLVGHLAKDLVEFGWATIQNTERAQRIEHKVSRKLKLTQQQQAILAVLMLRRPQTLNEIKIRTDRMATFDGADAIRDILDAWLNSETPLVIRLPAGSGRREDRYYHTLGTEQLADLQDEQPSSAPQTSSKTDCCEALEARVAELEKRLAALEMQLT
jgi:hypothetical protein